jgi:hypothetical protein
MTKLKMQFTGGRGARCDAGGRGADRCGALADKDATKTWKKNLIQDQEYDVLAGKFEVTLAAARRMPIVALGPSPADRARTRCSGSCPAAPGVSGQDARGREPLGRPQLH